MRFIPIVAVIFLACAANAQPVSPPPESGASEEILVAEERGGPSFWRLHDGDTEIFVLPAVSFLPKGFRWNDRGVARLVAKSDSVLIGARIEASAGDKARMAGAMLRTMTVSRGRLYMPKGETLETHVGPELAAAFARASARVEARRKSEGRDDADTADATAAEADDAAIERELADADPSRRHPFLQANALTGAAAKSAGLVAFRGVDKRVEKIADKADVPVRPLVEKRLVFSDAKKFLTSMKDFSDETDRACVAEAVDFADNRLERQRMLAEAWANGDAAALRRAAEAPRESACLNAVSRELGGLATFGGQTIADIVAPEFLADALETSLEKPGVRLAVVNADGFLAAGGALDVLRERGVAIDAPDGKGSGAPSAQ